MARTAGIRELLLGVVRVATSWTLVFLGPDLIWRHCLACLPLRPANYLALALHAVLGLALGVLARSRVHATLLVAAPLLMVSSEVSLAFLATLAGCLGGRILLERLVRAPATDAPAPSRQFPLDFLDASALVGAGLWGAVSACVFPAADGSRQHFSIMGCRLDGLRETLRGLEATGVPLVSEREGKLIAAELGDDGLYYFVPKIAHVLGVSVVGAYDLLLFAILMISVTLALAGSVARFRSGPNLLLMALFTVNVGRTCFTTGDVYIVAPCLIMAILPAFLAYASNYPEHWSFPVFGAGVGIVSGFANTLRSHASTPVLIFMAVTLLLGARSRLRRHLLVLGCVAAGLAVPKLFFTYLRHERDVYASRNVADYRPPEPQHPLWHSVYIGLGYVKNDHGIVYDDACASDKVKSIRPNVPYVSAEYEAILREEVFKLVRDDPRFIAHTILAKLLTIFRSLLVWESLGLLLLLRPSSWRSSLAYGPAIAFAAIPGVVAIPIVPYMAGFRAFATFASATSVAEVVERGGFGAWLGRLGARRSADSKSAPAEAPPAPEGSEGRA